MQLLYRFKHMVSKKDWSIDTSDNRSVKPSIVADRSNFLIVTICCFWLFYITVNLTFLNLGLLTEKNKNNDGIMMSIIGLFIWSIKCQVKVKNDFVK